jgi:hypothetical protein
VMMISLLHLALVVNKYSILLKVLQRCETGRYKP